MPVPANGNSRLSRQRKMLEPIISQHMEGFGEALEGVTSKITPERTRAHTLMRIAQCAGHQASHVARSLVSKGNPFAANEATLASSTLQANVTNFVTQMIHTNLEVYPRLIAPRLMSVQPFTQPSGYIFFLKRIAKNNGAGGGGAGRSLADLDTFDSTYGDHTNEGDQVNAVGVQLTKTLVEVEYMALMHQGSHEVEVALRSQYGLDLSDLGNLFTAEELAWEVDRKLVSGLYAFAATNPRGDLTFDTTKGGTYASLTPSEQKAYNQSFVTDILNQGAVEMGHDIFRSPNFYACGTNVASLLAKTPNAMAEKTGDTGYFDQALVQGSIIQSGRMRDGTVVLHDPQMNPNHMVMGHYDNMNPFMAGYIMSPFGMASLLTAAFQDPDTLLRKQARALAFAQVGVNPKQYRRIRLTTS
jgi:hypothetical protein